MAKTPTKKKVQNPIFEKIRSFEFLKKELFNKWSSVDTLCGNLKELQLLYHTVLKRRREISLDDGRMTAIDFFIKQYYCTILYVIDEITTLQNGRLVREWQERELDSKHATERKNFFNAFSKEKAKDITLTLLSIDGVAHVRLSTKLDADLYMAELRKTNWSAQNQAWAANLKNNVFAKHDTDLWKTEMWGKERGLREHQEDLQKLLVVAKDSFSKLFDSESFVTGNADGGVMYYRAIMQHYIENKIVTIRNNLLKIIVPEWTGASTFAADCNSNRIRKNQVEQVTHEATVEWLGLSKEAVKKGTTVIEKGFIVAKRLQQGDDVSGPTSSSAVGKAVVPPLVASIPSSSKSTKRKVVVEKETPPSTNNVSDISGITTQGSEDSTRSENLFQNESCSFSLNSLMIDTAHNNTSPVVAEGVVTALPLPLAVIQQGPLAIFNNVSSSSTSLSSAVSVDASTTAASAGSSVKQQRAAAVDSEVISSQKAKRTKLLKGRSSFLAEKTIQYETCDTCYDELDSTGGEMIFIEEEGMEEGIWRCKECHFKEPVVEEEFHDDVNYNNDCMPADAMDDSHRIKKFIQGENEITYMNEGEEEESSGDDKDEQSDSGDEDRSQQSDLSYHEYVDGNVSDGPPSKKVRGGDGGKTFFFYNDLKGSLKDPVQPKNMIDTVYEGTDYDMLISGGNKKQAHKVNHAIFADLIVEECMSQIASEATLSVNVMAHWNTVRQIENLHSDEIVTIDLDNLFNCVRKRVLRRMNVGIPEIEYVPASAHPGAILIPMKKPSSKETLRSEALKRRVANRVVTRVCKRIILMEESLNDTVLSLPLKRFQDCGFILPSSKSGSAGAVGVDMILAIGESKVIQFMQQKNFDKDDYLSFKTNVLTKTNRNCYQSKKQLNAAGKKLKKQAEKKQKKEQEISNVPNIISSSSVGNELDNSLPKPTTGELAAIPSQPQPSDLMPSDSPSQPQSSQPQSSDSTSSQPQSSDSTSSDSTSSQPQPSDSVPSGLVIQSPAPVTRGGVVDVELDVLVESEIDQVSPQQPGHLSLISFTDASSTTTPSLQPVTQETTRSRPAMSVETMLLRLFKTQSTGTSGSVRIIEEKSKLRSYNKETEYCTDLACLVLLIADFKSNGESSDIIDSLIDSEPINRISFSFQKAFPVVGNDQTSSAYGNTVGDGYCGFRASDQAEQRSLHDMTAIEDLIAYDKASKSDGRVAEHIGEYITSVNYADPFAQKLALTKLGSAHHNAVSYPNTCNPACCYCDSDWMRFVGFPLHLFRFNGNGSTEECDIDDKRCCWTTLVTVSYMLFEKFFDGVPVLKLKQISKICAEPNYVGYQPGHFFVLANSLNDSELLALAVRDWFGALVSQVEMLSDSDLRNIRVFHHSKRQTAFIEPDLPQLDSIDGSYNDNGNFEINLVESLVKQTTAVTDHSPTNDILKPCCVVQWSTPSRLTNQYERDDILKSIDFMAERMRKMELRNAELEKMIAKKQARK